MLTIHYVNKESDEIGIIRTLFEEYANELNENLCFQSFDDELKDPLKKYGRPNGCLLLAHWNDKPAGCIALQPLQQQGLCEMKRLYVRHEFRKHGIANELVRLLLIEAKAMGYEKMVLDTLERLQPAIRLYEKIGFAHTSAYYKNPLPSVVYMEKKINNQ